MNVPAAMQEYMRASGVGEEHLRASGELSLVFDTVLRVRLVPMPDGAIALESRVRAMPTVAGERERLVERALKLSLGRMEAHSDVLALDEDRQGLRLQSIVRTNATRAELEQRLEAHLNALAFWRSALA